MTGKGIPVIDKYRLVDENNIALSRDYLSMNKCYDYCVVSDVVGDEILSGIIDRDGIDIMPCKYLLPATAFIKENSKRVQFFYDNKTGVMDFYGNIILKPTTGYIRISDSFIVVKTDVETAYTINGTLLFSNAELTGSGANKLIAWQDDNADIYSITYKDYDVPFKGKYDDLPVIKSDNKIQHAVMSFLFRIKNTNDDVWQHVAETINKALQTRDKEHVCKTIFGIIADEKLSIEEKQRNLTEKMLQIIESI